MNPFLSQIGSQNSRALTKVLRLQPRAFYDTRFSNITSSGGRVSAIQDLSGNGLDATQGNSTRQPSVGELTLDGERVISFGADLTVAIADLETPTLFSGGLDGNSHSMIVVAAGETVSGEAGEWQVIAHAATPIRERITTLDSNAPGLRVLLAGGPNGNFSVNENIAANTGFFAGYSYNGSTLNEIVRVNSSESTRTGTLSNDTSGDVTGVFGNPFSSTLVRQGGILAAIYFDRALTSDELIFLQSAYQPLIGGSLA